MRLGIFGGSFDPVHLGHLILAEQCREQAELDKVLFVPAAISPLKEQGPVASNKQRKEMLSLAIAGHADFEISDAELERDGISYTVDTLTQLTNEYTGTELFFLMGEDSLKNFFRWKDPERICQLATPIVVRRPGIKNQGTAKTVNLSPLEAYMADDKFRSTSQMAIQSRLVDISSTDIRDRVSQQKSVRYLLPRAVEKYIQTNKLYLSR